MAAPRAIAIVDNAALALVLAALVLAGSRYSAFNAILAFAGLLLLSYLVWRSQLTPAARWAAICVGTIAGAIMIQLVPLPFGVWSALPGREVPAAIAQLAGPGWLAISLAPHLTLAVMPTLLPVAALAIWAAGAPDASKARFAVLIVGLAALSTILGLFQFSDMGLHLYETTHEGNATGFFANRNHQALLLALAIVFLPPALRALRKGPDAARSRAWLYGGMIFFAVGAVMTTSRSGMMLCLIAAALVIGRNALEDRSAGRPAALRPLVVAGAIGAAAILLLAIDSDTLPILNRFLSSTQDLRFVFWENTWFAVQVYFPFGSGIGTFQPVYNSVEDLETMAIVRANEAHNEYLQLLLEGGLLFALIAIAAIGGFVVLAWRRRNTFIRDEFALAIAASIVFVAVHSLADYPLRSYALLLPFAAISGFFLQLTIGRRRPAQDA